MSRLQPVVNDGLKVVHGTACQKSFETISFRAIAVLGILAEHGAGGSIRCPHQVSFRRPRYLVEYRFRQT